MKDFLEQLKSYAESNGFKEIDEQEITKPEFREKRLLNPQYALIMRKEVDQHLFYILVDKDLTHERFSLRVYHKLLDDAPRSDYQMRISEFLKHNDNIEYAFRKIYNDTLNFKG